MGVRCAIHKRVPLLPVSLSTPRLLLYSFFFSKDRGGQRESESWGGLYGWHGRGCRIPFGGRPAVYARFGGELMRQESDEFSKGDAGRIFRAAARVVS
jgi:hypothetical protein